MYITLPSNASMHLYPNNTLQNYKTQVSITEDFVGKWEVGLVNITYPRMWYNVTNEDTRCYALMDDKSRRNCEIPEGRYTSVEQLVDALNTALNSMIPNGYEYFNLSYNTLTRKVTYNIDVRNTTSSQSHPRVIGTSFSKGVSNILGFQDIIDRKIYPEARFMQNVDEFTGQLVADLNKGIHSLYVYSDIIEPCPVGDTRVPLLRVVPIEEPSNSTSTMQCSQSFTRVHYHPLRHRHITHVEIDIKDSIGRPVSFERGELMVTLHVRRAKSVF